MLRLLINYNTWIAPVAALALLAACGEEDEGSSLEANKLVVNLEGDEVKTLCEEMNQKSQAAQAQLQSVVDGTCAMLGIVAALDPATSCEETLESCKQEINAEIAAEAEQLDCESDAAAFEDFASNCGDENNPVSVSELENCVTEAADAFAQAVSGITCDSTLESFSELQDGANESTRCQEIFSLCTLPEEMQVAPPSIDLTGGDFSGPSL